MVKKICWTLSLIFVSQRAWLLKKKKKKIQFNFRNCQFSYYRKLPKKKYVEFLSNTNILSSRSTGIDKETWNLNSGT